MLLTTVDLGIPDGIAHAQSIPLTGRPAVHRKLGVEWNQIAQAQIWSDVQAMLRAVNASRKTQGLRDLTLDVRLCAVAREHAIDMAEQNYFSHDSLDGESPFDRMERAGIRYEYAGENIALDQDENDALAALMGSAEHRANILGQNYGRIGIAAVRSGNSEIFVQDFSD